MSLFTVRGFRGGYRYASSKGAGHIDMQIDSAQVWGFSHIDMGKGRECAVGFVYIT